MNVKYRPKANVIVTESHNQQIKKQILNFKPNLEDVPEWLRNMNFNLQTTYQSPEYGYQYGFRSFHPFLFSTRTRYVSVPQISRSFSTCYVSAPMFSKVTRSRYVSVTVFSKLTRTRTAPTSVPVIPFFALRPHWNINQFWLRWISELETDAGHHDLVAMALKKCYLQLIIKSIFW